MTYVITFFSHFGAISFNKAMKARGFASKMMPVPRAVSSSCGTGVRIEGESDISPFADEEVDRIFLKEGDVYSLVWQNHGSAGEERVC